MQDLSISESIQNTRKTLTGRSWSSTLAPHSRNKRKCRPYLGEHYNQSEDRHDLCPICCCSNKCWSQLHNNNAKICNIWDFHGASVWRSKSPGMWHCAFGLVFSDISEEHEETPSQWHTVTSQETWILRHIFFRHSGIWVPFINKIHTSLDAIKQKIKICSQRKPKSHSKQDVPA